MPPVIEHGHGSKVERECAVNDDVIDKGHVAVELVSTRRCFTTIGQYVLGLAEDGESLNDHTSSVGHHGELFLVHPLAEELDRNPKHRCCLIG